MRRLAARFSPLLFHALDSLKMTTPDERTRTVMQARQFLQELAWSAADAGIPEPVRREAVRLLRHYPGGSEMDLAHMALPQWFGEVPGRRGDARPTGGVAASEGGVESRVGIVQSLDLERARCRLMDGLTEKLHLFVAKSDAARSALAKISVGRCVDYQINTRGRVVSVGMSPADE